MIRPSIAGFFFLLTLSGCSRHKNELDGKAFFSCVQYFGGKITRSEKSGMYAPSISPRECSNPVFDEYRVLYFPTTTAPHAHFLFLVYKDNSNYLFLSTDTPPRIRSTYSIPLKNSGIDADEIDFSSMGTWGDEKNIFFGNRTRFQN